VWVSGGAAPLFLTSALDGGEWSSSCPSDWRMGGPQDQSGRCGIEEILLPLPRIELRTLIPLPVAIATERTMAAADGGHCT
jgi:hypothetical protein